MDCRLTRRQMLQFLTLVLPASLFGHKAVDYFDEELVCVHVYRFSQKLPKPLLEMPGETKRRDKNRSYFQIGLPELIVCRTESKLLDLFEYFWPVTRSEIKRFQRVSQVLFDKPMIEKIDHLPGFETVLRRSRQRKSGSLVAIFTLNDHTRNACSRLVKICVDNGADELIVFKDPSKPPYLCSFPSQQKGFKKKPPIGGDFKKKARA